MPLPLLAIGLCVILNMMDGYDILIMAFAAPAIRSEWGLSTAETGLIFSAGLAGMGVGGMTLAALADLLGRRRIILTCLALTTAGMLLCACAASLGQMVACRFVTGLGVGGMMPAINTIVAEYATGRRRNLAIVLQAAGYPLGGTLGGLLALRFSSAHGWQSLFLVGGTVSALLLPAAFRWITESAEYLASRQLPKSLHARRDIGLGALLGRGLAQTTLAICAATFCVQFTFYFVVNWAPVLLRNGGPASGIGMSGAVLLNVGGIVGDVIFGIVCLRVSPRRLGALAMFICFVSIAALAYFPREEGITSVVALLIGCFLFASMASLYAIAPSVFPPLARSSGTGVALSAGRIGATIGPWMGALLMGSSLQSVVDTSAVLAAPLLFAAALLVFRLRER